MTLNHDQLTAVADKALRSKLGSSGFERAEVTTGEDHDGDPAIFVTAHFRSGSRVPTGSVLSEAMSALHESFRAKGEERFPYFTPRFHNDERFEDEDVDGANPR